MNKISKLGIKGVTGVDFSGTRYDMGNKFGILKANIEVGLNHPETKEDLKKYIKEYKKARLNPHIKRYQMLCAFSTLQYFEKYIRDI